MILFGVIVLCEISLSRKDNVLEIKHLMLNKA